MLPVKQADSRSRKLRIAVVDLTLDADQNFVALIEGEIDTDNKFVSLIKRLMHAFDMVLLCNTDNEDIRQLIFDTIIENNDKAQKAHDLDHAGWTIKEHDQTFRSISGDCQLQDIMIHRADKLNAISVWYELRRTPFQRSLLHPHDLIWCPGFTLQAMTREPGRRITDKDKDEGPATIGDWINRWDCGSTFVRKATSHD